MQISDSSLQATVHHLTPWGMFLSADWVVKTVMIVLALASVATWTILFAKQRQYAATRRALQRACDAAAGAGNLPALGAAPALAGGIAHAMLAAASGELQLSAGLAPAEGIKQRLASRLQRVESRALRQLRRGTGVLATIGSVAPFVGLFGTVWGIMNSFIGIAMSNTTNLAVVAPGIAEALLATAMGLVAAIPAVVVYNHASRTLAAVRGVMGDLGASIEQIVSRDLDAAANGGS